MTAITDQTVLLLSLFLFHYFSYFLLSSFSLIIYVSFSFPFILNFGLTLFFLLPFFHPVLIHAFFVFPPDIHNTLCLMYTLSLFCILVGTVSPVFYIQYFIATNVTFSSPLLCKHHRIFSSLVEVTKFIIVSEYGRCHLMARSDSRHYIYLKMYLLIYEFCRSWGILMR